MAQMVKNLPTNMGKIGSISGYRRSPGEANGNPFQYSYLENSMDRGFPGPWDHKESNMTELLRHTHTHTHTHTESKKMLLLNLIAGKEWRHRYRKWTCGQWRKDRVGQMEKVASTYTHYRVK